jgi:hypothetical protein
LENKFRVLHFIKGRARSGPEDPRYSLPQSHFVLAAPKKLCKKNLMPETLYVKQIRKVAKSRASITGSEAVVSGQMTVADVRVQTSGVRP